VIYLYDSWINLNENIKNHFNYLILFNLNLCDENNEMKSIYSDLLKNVINENDFDKIDWNKEDKYIAFNFR